MGSDHKRIRGYNGMGWAHVQIGCLSAFVSSVSTTFIVGFFRHIGFSEFQVAAYGSAIGFACFFCVFGTWFSQRKGRYKSSVMVLFAAASFSCLFAVLIGGYSGGGWGVTVIILTLMGLYQLFICIAIPVLLSWMNGNIGQSNWQKFFSTRMIVSDSVLLVTVIIVGKILGENPQTGKFVAVFTVAVGFGIISVYAVKRIPDPVFAEAFPELKVYLGMIVDAIRRPAIRKLLFIAFLRSFAYGFIMPFQPMFLLEELHFDYAEVSRLICIGTVFSIAFYKIWAYVQKRMSDFKSLKWNLFLSVFEPFLWAFVAPKTLAFIYLAFAVFGYFGAQGMVNAGFWPSFVGSVFHLSDERHKPIYTTLYYLVFGAATMAAPLISERVLQHFNRLPVSFPFGLDIELNGYRIVFIIAGFILAATTIYATVGTQAQRINLEGKERLN